MTTILRITFDGETPGLAEHELSLDRFSTALGHLLTAFRRAANAVVDGDGPAAARGRLRRDAGRLDLRIGALERGSVGLQFTCSFAPGRDDLPGVIDDGGLAERAGTRFLDDLRQVVAGSNSPDLAAARHYVEALPAGIRTQTYESVVDGEVRARAELGATIETAAPDEGVPVLRSGVGVVVGVTFTEPAVRVRFDAGGKTLSLEATAADVDDAISLRGKAAVFVRYVEDGGRRRLLVLRDQTTSGVMPEAVRTEHIFSRWGEALRRLGQ